MTPLLTFQALLRAMKMVLPSNNPIVRIQNEPTIAPSRMLTSNPSPLWADNIMLIYTSDRSFDDKNMLLTIDFCCYTWTAFVNRCFHGKGHSISRYALVLVHRNRHSNSTYVQLLFIFMHPISSFWHPIFILLFSTDFFIHIRNKILTSLHLVHLDPAVAVLQLSWAQPHHLPKQAGGPKETTQFLNWQPNS